MCGDPRSLEKHHVITKSLCERQYKSPKIFARPYYTVLRKSNIMVKIIELLS